MASRLPPKAGGWQPPGALVPHPLRGRPHSHPYPKQDRLGPPYMCIVLVTCLLCLKMWDRDLGTLSLTPGGPSTSALCIPNLKAQITGSNKGAAGWAPRLHCMLPPRVSTPLSAPLHPAVLGSPRLHLLLPPPYCLTSQSAPALLRGGPFSHLQQRQSPPLSLFQPDVPGQRPGPAQEQIKVCEGDSSTYVGPGERLSRCVDICTLNGSDKRCVLWSLMQSGAWGPGVLLPIYVWGA